MADNNKNDAMENLFKAIDIITSERLSNLGYDKTIKATIIDDSKSAHGEYQLTDGSSTFTAYAADVLYKKDMTVYVIIPEGDYNNQLLIVGKCSNKGDAFYNYANPSDDFLDVTHNLITDVHMGEMIANYSEHNYIKLWSVDKVDYKGYNRLALKADFRTWLTPLEVVSGTYGLLLYVVSKETSYSGNDFERTYKFDLLTSDMYGDPFNFETYYLQEKVFDISEIPNIVSMELLLVQNCDFKNHLGELVAHRDEKNNLLPANIFCQTPYVALGYDLNDVKEDEVKLYTLDSESYDATYDQENIKKTAHVRWVHIQEDGVVVAIDKEDEIPANAIIHWYKYVLDRTVVDKLAGVFWEEIPEARNKFSYSFVPDILVANEKLKVIIESPSRESVIDSLEGTLFGNFTGIQIDKDPDTGANRTDEDVLKLALRSYNDNSLLSLQEYKQIIVEYNEKYKLDHQTDYTNYAAAISILDNIMRAQSDICIYKSETLTFENESYDPVAASIDLISGLTILVDAAGYNGSYLLYNDSGMIANPAESMKTRVLTAAYNSLITGEEMLDKAEKIVWYLPLEGTMIQPPQLGTEYSEFEIYSELTEEEIAALELPCKYCRIERAIPELFENEAGEEVARQTEQLFRIKDYYTQTATNNAIYCTVLKNGREYKAVADLVFGISGTNGTDATFLLKLYEVDENGAPTEQPASALTIGKTVAVVPKFFDYNNVDITDEYLKNHFVTYAWYQRDDGKGVTLIAPGTGSSNRFALLQCPAGTTIEDCQYHILSAQVQWSIVKYKKDDWGNVELDANGQPVPDESDSGDINTRSVQLKTFLPIPVRTDDKYTQVVGPTQIIYDKNGTNPTYYGVPFILYENGKEIETNWMSACEEYQDTKDARVLQYYPALNEEGKLTPPDMYVGTDRPYAVEALVPGVGKVWTQPILIIQNRYASPMLNSWDGSLMIDKENGTIMSTMVGAGIKDDNNTFSGVLMGDVAAGAGFNEKNHSGLGLYGFLKGEQSFGFNVNGTAFIGRAGRGRINFDGDKGTIQSGVYEQFVAGMQIDLDGEDTTSAALYAYGGGGSLEINTDPSSSLFLIRSGPSRDDNVLFFIGSKNNREFYMQSDNYVEGSTGTKIDLDDGTISIYKSNGSYVILDGEGSPYFQIHDGDSGKDIFIAGDSQFQLESTNFVSGESGIFIDLQAGEFEARAGIIGGWTINQDTLTAESITLNSNGSISGGTEFPWSIETDGKATFSYITAEGGGKIGPFEINDQALFISGGTFEGSTVYLGTGGISVNNKAFSASAAGDVYISGDLTVEGKSNIKGNGYLGDGSYGGSGTSGYWGFTSSGGHIGPWTIDEKSIRTNYSELGAEGTLSLRNNANNGFEVSPTETKIYFGTNGLTVTSTETTVLYGTTSNYGLTVSGSKATLLFGSQQNGLTVNSIYAKFGFGADNQGIYVSGSQCYAEFGENKLKITSSSTILSYGGDQVTFGVYANMIQGKTANGWFELTGSEMEMAYDSTHYFQITDSISMRAGNTSLVISDTQITIDGNVCQQDTTLSIWQYVIGKQRLYFHKGLLIEKKATSGDENTGNTSNTFEVDVDTNIDGHLKLTSGHNINVEGGDVVVKGHISAYKPDQSAGSPVPLGKMAFVDDITKKFDVTATGSITTYEQNGYQNYYSTYSVDYDRDSEGNITGVDVDIDPIRIMTYRQVTKTVTITSNNNAVTLAPNAGAIAENIALSVSGTAKLS